MYFKEQTTKNSQTAGPHDEVQRLIFHSGVMGWPVEGGRGSPEAYDRRVKQGGGDLALEEGQSPTVGLVELHRKETAWLLEHHCCRRAPTTAGAEYNRREGAMFNFTNPLLIILLFFCLCLR